MMIDRRHLRRAAAPALVCAFATLTAACAGGRPYDASYASSPDHLEGRALYDAFLSELGLRRKQGGIKAVEEIESGDPFGEVHLASMMWSDVSSRKGTPAYARWMPQVLRLYETACGNGLGHACHRLAEYYLPSANLTEPRVDPWKALSLFERGCEARYPSSDACIRAGVAYLNEPYWSVESQIEVARDDDRFLRLAHRGCLAGIGDVPNESCRILINALEGGKPGVEHPDPALAAQYRRVQWEADQRSQNFWAEREAQDQQWFDNYAQSQQAAVRNRSARIQGVLDALAAVGRAIPPPPTFAAPVVSHAPAAATRPQTPAPVVVPVPPSSAAIESSPPPTSGSSPTPTPTSAPATASTGSQQGGCQSMTRCVSVTISRRTGPGSCEGEMNARFQNHCGQPVECSVAPLDGNSQLAGVLHSVRLSPGSSGGEQQGQFWCNTPADASIGYRCSLPDQPISCRPVP